MKKWIVVILVVFVAGVSFGTLVSNQSEAKIAGIVRSISSICNRANSTLGERYNEAKNYITAYPNQFEASDKTKLNGLEAHITKVKTELNALILYVNTEFPGLME